MGIFIRVLLVPPRILMPIVAMVSFVGIYGIAGSSFDLLIMVAFGVAGWIFRKLDVPLVPVILGVLLGNNMESNLRRAITISDGDWTVLFASPLAITLWSISIIGFVLPIFVSRFMPKKPKPVSPEAEEEVSN